MSPTSYLAAPPRVARKNIASGTLLVAVIDIGSNSTRLMLAEVDGRRLEEVDRRTTVTRLAEGVDASGRLAAEAVERTADVIGGYAEAIAAAKPERVVTLATSAVRDAANGTEFRDLLRDRFGVDLRIIGGDEEARLTFAGATANRGAGDGPALVIDVGGGSTELVAGLPGGDPAFFVSTQAGAVRQSERHLHDDPPTDAQLASLRDDAFRILGAAVPQRVEVGFGIAVAGTPTSLAAIDQELDPYDPARVHGYRLSVDAAERIFHRLAALPLAERREVTGLDPARAPTIVAGAAILIEAARLFGLHELEVSEADILHGAALTSP